MDISLPLLWRFWMYWCFWRRQRALHHCNFALNTEEYLCSQTDGVFCHMLGDVPGPSSGGQWPQVTLQYMEGDVPARYSRFRMDPWWIERPQTTGNSCMSSDDIGTWSVSHRLLILCWTFMQKTFASLHYLLHCNRCNIFLLKFNSFAHFLHIWYT